MLTILLPVMSLLLLSMMKSKSWGYIMVSMVFIMLSTTTMFQYHSSALMSPMFLMDSMSTCMMLLSIWVTLLMFMASYKIHTSNSMLIPFSIISCLLLMVLLLCFSSENLLTFYIWFEASLIPTMMLILLWGYQPERLQASMYLMVYTVVASLPLLMIIMMINNTSEHTHMLYPWITFPSNMNTVTGSFIMLMAFMVKLPLFSVHLWLPKAHVEAPVAGSMILAAILLKLGGYGLMRMFIMFPEQAMYLYEPLTAIALTGAVITSLICLRQSDMKSLIAYSSVGHMGLLIAGVMSHSSWGLMGSLAMMVAHGVVSSGMFCLANLSYEMSHTRSIVLTKGLLCVTPTLSMLWFLMLSANMAAPPTINLLSEIMLITGTVSKNMILAIPLGVISFMSAAYSLYLYSALNHGGLPTISNTIPCMPTRYYLLIILHLLPAIFLITLPVFFTNYLT